MAEYTDLYYPSHDGLRLYARDYASASASRTLICIPGLTRNSADFEDLCAALADDYRVLAVDLRGRGLSDYDPEPLNYHPGTYVRDIESLIDALQLESASLIGTSLGGVVSMLLASVKAEFVERIVLNDIGPELNPVGVARIRGYVNGQHSPSSWSEAIVLAKEIHCAALPDLSDGAWEKFTRRLYRQGASELLLNYDEHIADLFDVVDAADPDAQAKAMWEVYKQLSTLPIFVIRGEFSDILSAQTLAEMAKLNAHVRSIEVSNRGHAPLLDETGVIPAIRGFLAER